MNRTQGILFKRHSSQLNVKRLDKIYLIAAELGNLASSVIVGILGFVFYDSEMPFSAIFYFTY